MKNYNPEITLREGDRIAFDNKHFQIMERAGNDRFVVRDVFDEEYDDRHIDWFGKMESKADTVTLVRE